MVSWIFLSIVLEEIFDALFDWKVYKRLFDGKGLKFPIKFLLIMCMLFAYPKTDIFRNLLDAMKLNGESGMISYTATALLLSGGSATAYKVLRKFKKAKEELKDT